MTTAQIRLDNSAEVISSITNSSALKAVLDLFYETHASISKVQWEIKEKKLKAKGYPKKTIRSSQKIFQKQCLAACEQEAREFLLKMLDSRLPFNLKPAEVVLTVYDEEHKNYFTFDLNSVPIEHLENVVGMDLDNAWAIPGSDEETELRKVLETNK